VNRGNDWDKCAALLTIEDNAVFKRQVRSLIGNFIDDMKLTFSDSGTQQSLFETGFP
jgi:chromosomal replication initiation ATPase DnaA